MQRKQQERQKEPQKKLKKRNMEQVRFTINGALSFAWARVKERLSFFVGFAAIIAVIQIVNSYIQSVLEESGATFVVLFVYIIFSIIIGLVISLWQIRVALDTVDGKQPTYDSMQQSFPLMGRAFTAQIFYGLIVMIGFLLLIIPGFIWMIKYQYVLYYVVDKNMTVFEALEESGKITKGEKWHLFIFGLAIGLVLLVGILALGVGILVAFPVVVVAQGYVYRQLQYSLGKSETVTPPTIETPPKDTLKEA